MTKLLLFFVLSLSSMFISAQDANSPMFNPLTEGYQVIAYTDESADERLKLTNNSSYEDAFKIALLCTNRKSGNEWWIKICTTTTLTNKNNYKKAGIGQYFYKTDKDLDEIDPLFNDNISKIAVKSKSGRKYKIEASEYRSDLHITISDYINTEQDESKTTNSW